MRLYAVVYCVAFRHLINMDVANITASIRVDAATNKGSVIDVIRLINPSITSGNASVTLTNLTNSSMTLTENISQLQINGKGRPTPCADAATLVEIVWLLPGRAARDFRRASAQTVCRVLGGDLSMVQEIEARHHALQTSVEGQATQSFLTPPTPSPQPSLAVVDSLPVQLQLASVEQKSAYFNLWMQEQREKQRMLVQKAEHEQKQTQITIIQSGYQALTAFGVADARDKIAFADMVRRVTQSASRTEMSACSTAIVAAEPVPADDITIPTPDCHPVHRGTEISMHSVAAKYGLRIRAGTEGTIGKLMKTKYVQKYGEQAGKNIPKREVPFKGRIYAENTYYSRDESMMRDAISSI